MSTAASASTDFLLLPSLTGVAGTVRLPGSKSISNRVLLLAALSQGTTVVRDLLDSDDTRVMLAALRTLGVEWEAIGDNDYRVRGVAGRFPTRSADIFVGNAGTAVRPLTAALALQGGDYRLSGVHRMHERPIGDLVDGLRQVGANIDYLGTPGYPPLHLHDSAIRVVEPIRVRGDVSSQFLTALLMALPLVQTDSGKIEIEMVGELISKPYVEITLNLLRRFGIEVEQNDWSRFVLPAGRTYTPPAEIFVEGDASSASYFLAAGAIGGGPVRVEGVGHSSIQGDIRFVEALNQMGANVMAGDTWIEVRGVEHDNGRLRAIDLDCNHIPDAAMTLAVAALFADGTTTLRNIASWRVKETDRLTAMATELRKVGAVVEEGADYLRVTPPTQWQSPPSGIDTYDDHRMAMCFSLAAFGPCPIRINEPDCVAKTFPTYFEVFQSIASPAAG
jgi:3-phosphoshikimate 1-carboxyvinyltransferase